MPSNNVRIAHSIYFWKRFVPEIGTRKAHSLVFLPSLSLFPGFRVLSEAERTAALYSLLQESTQVQIRFFITVLQQMARSDPMSALLSPNNPNCESPNECLHFSSDERQSDSRFFSALWTVSLKPPWLSKWSTS